MDQLLDFVLTNQNKISNDTKISIKIGKDLGNGIFDLKISKDNCKNILNKIKQSNLQYTVGSKCYRIYKDSNMEYRICESEEINTSKDIIESDQINIGDKTYCLFLEKTNNLELTDFPNLTEYKDIVNNNVLKIYINNLFYLNINIDETSSGSYQTLSIHMDKENIYKDKIKENLENIINIIKDNY